MVQLVNKYDDDAEDKICLGPYVIYFTISGTKSFYVALLTGCTEVYKVAMVTLSLFMS